MNVVAANDSPPARPPAAELDELTMVRAQRGEAAASRAFVLRYERPVFALIGRILGPRGRREIVEDLAQETFLRAFRALPRFDRGAAARPSTWLLTIATRVTLDELRRVAPGLIPLDVDADVGAVPFATPRPEQRLDDKRRGQALVRAVEALSPEHRAVVLLRDVYDFAYDEIAVALEIDLGTVKSRLSRARAALRAALGGSDGAGHE